MIEAGIAYHQATGKSKILDVVCKVADNIDEVFGSEPGKLKGYDGHQEIELALMKLYDTTGNERYVQLCRFFLEERGTEPHFYDTEAEKRGGTFHWDSDWMIKDKSYSQAHEPIHDQKQAVGHAVRFVYMCTGMAHLAAATGDEEMLQSCKRLWDSMVSKQMYITGGIGSQSHGEAFSDDYDLPNDTVYAETCASCGMVFFSHRMLQLEPDSRYADVLERALYNTVLGGMSRDGKSFFYVNPLEVYPQVCSKNQNYQHVKPERQSWFGCSCCPPNVARLIASLGQYIYTYSDNTIYAHLYIGGEAAFDLPEGRIGLTQQTNYPWEGSINFSVQAAEATEFTLALRIPDWCNHAEISVNGKAISLEGLVVNGYAKLQGTWSDGDTVALHLAMPVIRMKGHPLIRHTAQKVAIQRGPLVYCLEEVDNGASLHHLLLPKYEGFEIETDSSLMVGMIGLTAMGKRNVFTDWGDSLYKQNEEEHTEFVRLHFIPYFAWANRGVGEMRVWVSEESIRAIKNF